jgi:hypothetical protein
VVLNRFERVVSLALEFRRLGAVWDVAVELAAAAGSLSALLSV